MAEARARLRLQNAQNEEINLNARLCNKKDWNKELRYETLVHNGQERIDTEHGTQDTCQGLWTQKSIHLYSHQWHDANDGRGWVCMACDRPRTANQLLKERRERQAKK